MKQRYDLETVKAAARGYWPTILNRVAGIDDDYLTSRAHGPCPKCGGNDPWRCFDDWKDTGGAVCNRCGKMADGFAVIQNITGAGFLDVVRMVAEFLGVKPEEPGSSRNGKPSAKPDAKQHKIEWLPWNEMIVSMWCMKRGFSLEAVKACGARLGRYGERKENVIAFPLYSEDGEPAGWSLYQASGRKLEQWNPKTKETEWLKMKTIKT